jgi:hypothetical protein
MSLSANGRELFAFALRESAAVAGRLFAAKSLPAADRHVDVKRVDLATVANAGRGFRSNDRGARADERIVDRLTRAGVVDDRAAHDVDWFLTAMIRNKVFARISLHHLGFNHSGFVSISVPTGRFTFQDGIPARFVLSAIMTAREMAACSFTHTN